MNPALHPHVRHPQIPKEALHDKKLFWETDGLNSIYILEVVPVISHDDRYVLFACQENVKGSTTSLLKSRQVLDQHFVNQIQRARDGAGYHFIFNGQTLDQEFDAFDQAFKHQKAAFETLMKPLAVTNPQRGLLASPKEVLLFSGEILQAQSDGQAFLIAKTSSHAANGFIAVAQDAGNTEKRKCVQNGCTGELPFFQLASVVSQMCEDRFLRNGNFWSKNSDS